MASILRLAWTRSWVKASDTQRKASNVDDFDIIDHDDANVQEFGVASIDSDESNASLAPVDSASEAISADAPRYGGWHPEGLILGCSCCGLLRWCSTCATFHTRGSLLQCMESSRASAEGLEDVARKDGVNYELAGREVGNAFKDVRSAAKARKRTRMEREKYCGYTNVNPGWLSAQIHDLHHDDDFCDLQVRRVPNVTITKKMLFEEAQRASSTGYFHLPRRRQQSCPACQRIRERKHQHYHIVEARDHDRPGA